MDFKHYFQTNYPEELAHINKVVDGLGLHIDEGIKYLVLTWNLLGIETIASCQGHADRGLPVPWIDVAAKDYFEIMEQIRELQKTGIYDNYKHLIQIHITEIKPMFTLASHSLDKFYSINSYPSSKHIVMHVFGYLVRFTINEDPIQQVRTQEGKKKCLEEYHIQINYYTEFLISNYLEKGINVSNFHSDTK